MKQNKILQIALKKTKETNTTLSEFLAKNVPKEPAEVMETSRSDEAPVNIPGPFIT